MRRTGIVNIIVDKVLLYYIPIIFCTTTNIFDIKYLTVYDEVTDIYDAVTAGRSITFLMWRYL